MLLDPPENIDGTPNFQTLSDPTLNIILAGLCLFFEISGNICLILRFSNYHTKLTTWISFICWIIKLCIGIANYTEFGVLDPETSNIIYLEGFWVGVASMSVTFIIIIFLSFNLAFLHKQSAKGSVSILI